MTERIIQRALSMHFSNYEYKLFNSFVYAWESDFFAISKSRYATEVEIKISRADFRNDFKSKPEKHVLFDNHKMPALVHKKWPFVPYLRKGETGYEYRVGDSSSLWFCCPADRLPNKLYYAVPEDLISVDECPSYAGLLYIRDRFVVEVKKAPFLHKQHNDLNKILLDKFHWKTKNLKADISEFIYHLEMKLPDDQLERIRDGISRLKAIV